MDVQGLFYVAIIAIALFFLARHFEDYAFGLMSGLLMFLLGLNLFINPISDISALLNDVISSIFFGTGAYIFVRGGIELINQYI